MNSAGLVNFEASLSKALEVNAIGVRNVLDFCRKTGAAMMHVSTCYVAGVADGHRFEDDVPRELVPNRPEELQPGAGNSPKRWLQSRHVEAESREQLRNVELGTEAEDDSSEEDHARAHDRRRKGWVEERLKEIGRQRARKWGWPNTYSYTKSLGEQLMFAARESVDITVVRPAVIEGALHDPFPGWNQGVNTSAPLTYLTGHGYRFYPATAELVLDVIPVDLVAHAMVPILGALILKRQKPVYQLCTSDLNPLPMRRLVELTGLANRRVHRKDKGEMGWFARHMEAVVASQNTYELAINTLPRLLKQATDLR